MCQFKKIDAIKGWDPSLKLCPALDTSTKETVAGSSGSIRERGHLNSHEECRGWLIEGLRSLVWENKQN